MTLDSMQDLYMDHIQDLYSTETQILGALPMMIDRVSHAKLRDGLETHLEQTRQHAKRLHDIAKGLGRAADGKTCRGMKGLLEEGSEILKAKGDDDVVDAALISAVQRIEHYEIAAYGCARAFAEALGRDEDIATLQQTLDEEGEANERLTRIAETVVNPDAARNVHVHRGVPSAAMRESGTASRRNRPDARP